eukprot:scaffold32250_cov31-Tisochrysis_lutea.AAC.5
MVRRDSGASKPSICARLRGVELRGGGPSASPIMRFARAPKTAGDAACSPILELSTCLAPCGRTM